MFRLVVGSSFQTIINLEKSSDDIAKKYSPGFIDICNLSTFKSCELAFRDFHNSAKVGVCFINT